MAKNIEIFQERIKKLSADEQDFAESYLLTFISEFIDRDIWESGISHAIGFAKAETIQSEILDVVRKSSR